MNKKLLASIFMCAVLASPLLYSQSKDSEGQGFKFTCAPNQALTDKFKKDENGKSPFPFDLIISGGAARVNVFGESYIFKYEGDLGEPDFRAASYKNSSGETLIIYYKPRVATISGDGKTVTVGICNLE